MQRLLDPRRRVLARREVADEQAERGVEARRGDDALRVLGEPAARLLDGEVGRRVVVRPVRRVPRQRPHRRRAVGQGEHLARGPAGPRVARHEGELDLVDKLLGVVLPPAAVAGDVALLVADRLLHLEVPRDRRPTREDAQLEVAAVARPRLRAERRVGVERPVDDEGAHVVAVPAALVVEVVVVMPAVAAAHESAEAVVEHFVHHELEARLLGVADVLLKVWRVDKGGLPQDLSLLGFVLLLADEVLERDRAVAAERRARLVQEEPPIRLLRIAQAAERLIVAREARPAAALDGELARHAILGIRDDLLRHVWRHVAAAAAEAARSRIPHGDSAAWGVATIGVAEYEKQ